MKEKKSIKRIAVFAGITAAAAVLLFGPSLLAGDDAVIAQAAETPVYSVRTSQAQKQTLNAYLDVNGDIVSSQQVDVFPEVSGKLVAVHVNIGSYVNKGDVIAEVDQSRPGVTYMNSKVTAPISGIVSRTPVPVGMMVSPASSLTVISANGTLEITARIPEREIAGLVTGLKADVSLQAYPGENFTATVNRVSPVIDSTSRTKLINLGFDQSDSRINSGMFARLKINTRSYPDVLAVPAEAVITNRGTDFVYVIGTGVSGQPVALKREVSRGITLQGLTEIKAGLAEGDVVIVQGQQLLTGGESLRIVGSHVATANK